MEKNEYYSIDYFSRKTKDNEKSIRQEFEHDVERIKHLFDAQCKLFHCTVIPLDILEMIGRPAEYSVIYTAFYKNLFSLYSALDLTNKGLYGSARKLFRYSFEFLMIAKYCSITKEIDLIERWRDGKEIWLSKEVFKKINAPDVKEFKIFWGSMCSFTHPTIYSQQISLDWDKNKKEIELNYMFLRILLECNYHLLISHVTKPFIYYIKRYKEEKTNEEISKRKRKMRKELTANKEDMSYGSRKLIQCYKRKWKVH